ncbi:MAG: Si-specific NAD(P)(+) transhydrogenase [Acidobacteria bacterium]|nr:Si-specific NAD(P)(+) transhydrogenase [Acidobacteriota bacterium]
MPTEPYDVVIIGSGPAGEKAGAQAAYFGHRVAIIEKEPVVGGAMATTGTLPSKTLRETALFLTGFRQRNLYGVNLKLAEDITVRNFLHRAREVIRHQVQMVEENIARHKIDMFYGFASVVDPATVKVRSRTGGDNLLKTRFILIATGSYPHRPDDVPFDDTCVYDSDTILQLNDMPKSMTIIGGGVIGCEYASIFSTLGVDVHLVDTRDRVLPFVDGEIALRLQNHMKRQGVKFYFGEKYREVKTDAQGNVFTQLASGRVLVSDKFLFAAGRNGAVRDLGLEAVGIAVSSRGLISVNEHYQTAVPNIYAAGDVIGFPSLASTSMEQGRLAMCHAFNLSYKKKLASYLPYGIYTVPEISMVGLTEEEAKRNGVDYEVGLASFGRNPRGQIIGDSEGMVKLVFRAEDQQLLGVHVIGELAAELVQVGLGCLYYHGTIDYFIQSVFNFPTLSESYKYAAYDGLGRLAARGHGPS